MKAIRGKKTGKKDAKWIADIFKHDLAAGSFIPPADIRQKITRIIRAGACIKPLLVQCSSSSGKAIW